MHIEQIFGKPLAWDPDPVGLWEQNMHEPWDDYKVADMFILRDDDGTILGGFAVYHEESDGIVGNFCSGWAARHKNAPIEAVLQQLVLNVGDVYFKTDQRAAKFLLEKIAKRVKKTERFCYYIIRGKKNGKTKRH